MKQSIAAFVRENANFRTENRKEEMAQLLKLATEHGLKVTEDQLSHSFSQSKRDYEGRLRRAASRLGEDPSLLKLKPGNDNLIVEALVLADRALQMEAKLKAMSESMADIAAAAKRILAQLRQ